MSYNLRVKGNIITNVGGKTRIYAKEGFEINSNKSIIYSAPEYTYGDPEDPPKRVHPDIVSVQFLDENNSVLKQENIAKFGGIKATNVLYAKKLKIKIVTKEVTDGTKIEFAVKGNSKKESQKFLKIDALKWNLEIQNDTCETDLFNLSVLWYNEDYECYDYNLHKTKIKAEDLNTFTIKGILCLIPFELLNDEDELKPIAYLRNYEELTGLFNTDNSGEKTLIDNYENKFINYNPEIFKIASEFLDYLSDTDDLTLSDIKARVKADAKKLWEAAVKQVQAGNLDDRPLYWSRNKMQVSLKRNPLFENDINFETSTVNKDSELEKIIQLFEEQSRNYTNIDFSKAVSKKKVLIVGFDPFQLNSINHPYKDYYNILQSNPSGVIALALANSSQLGAYIQTMVVPVRYADFDSSQEFSKGQGVGIIEKHIKPLINEVDMIITISQAGKNDYHIDLFATATRAGGDDNVNFVRIDGSKSINDISPETIKTTLPIEMTQGNSEAIFWGDFFASKQDEIDYYKDKNKFFDKKQKATLSKYPTNKIYSGPGGNYLSNEIFYRVAKLRMEQRATLPTGHFHINKIQDESIKEDLNFLKMQEVLNVVKKSLLEGIKGL